MRAQVTDNGNSIISDNNKFSHFVSISTHLLASLIM